MESRDALGQVLGDLLLTEEGGAWGFLPVFGEFWSRVLRPRSPQELGNGACSPKPPKNSDLPLPLGHLVWHQSPHPFRGTPPGVPRCKEKHFGDNSYSTRDGAVTPNRGDTTPGAKILARQRRSQFPLPTWDPKPEANPLQPQGCFQEQADGRNGGSNSFFFFRPQGHDNARCQRAGSRGGCSGVPPLRRACAAAALIIAGASKTLATPHASASACCKKRGTLCPEINIIRFIIIDVRTAP